MPKYQQIVTLSNPQSGLAIAHAAMTELNWKILLAGENNLIGITSKKFGATAQRVTVKINGDQMIVLSEITDGRLLDITGKNKRNVQDFVNAYLNINNNIDLPSIDAHNHLLEELKVNSIQLAQQQRKDAEELNESLNLAGSNLNASYAIIAVNTIVFILMIIDGAGIMGDNGLVHIKWGSDFKPLTLSGDWWRIITCTFIHFGIIHLAMNMYCLYTVAIYLEPMLGKQKYIAAYLCTGILSSLTSLWWHDQPVNSAGASGAVFGVYGVFLALLTTNLIPQKVRVALLKSIGLFVVYNLVYGIKSGVDNAAHVGGLLSGLIFGYAYAYTIRKEKKGLHKMQWVVPVLVLLSIGGSYFYIQSHKMDQQQRVAILNELKQASYKDNEKFNDVLLQFDDVNKKVFEVLSDTTLTNDSRTKKIDEVCIPQWEKVEALLRSTVSFDVSQYEHDRARKLISYIGLRKQEMNIIKQIDQAGSAEGLFPELKENRKKADELYMDIIGK